MWYDIKCISCIRRRKIYSRQGSDARGAVPTSADILGAGALSIQVLTSHQHVHVSKSYGIMCITWDFYGPRSREIRKYFKVNTKCTYNSSVQPVANCYFLLQLGTQTNATQQNLDIRTRFTD